MIKFKILGDNRWSSRSLLIGHDLLHHLQHLINLVPITTQSIKDVANLQVAVVNWPVAVLSWSVAIVIWPVAVASSCR